MIDEIVERYKKLDYVTNVETKNKIVFVQVAVNEIDDFSLTVSLSDAFPQKLPKISLDEPARYGFLPHVCWKGIVCYTDNQGVNIDFTRPADVAEFVLKKATEVLSIKKCEREQIFYNEFEGYWNQQDLIWHSYLFDDLKDKLELINVQVKKTKEPIAFFSDNKEVKLNDGYAFSNKCKSKKTQVRAFYFPLENKFPPPLPKETIGIQYLEKLIDALSNANKSLWEEYISNNDVPNTLYIIASQPRPSGGKSFFGLYVPYGLNWLRNKKKYNHQVIPLAILRHSPNYLLQRAGANTNLVEKKVAIIGCGSVGSRIAELLIMSGIRNLILIDYDLYEADNIFRHILDSRYINVNKATALSDQLQSRFPYISVEPVKERVTKWLSLFDDMDIVIDAAGEPTFSRKLNIEYHSNRNNDASLATTWLEPMGLGGHAVLSDGITNGCLGCLYHKDNTETLISKTNFISGNQVVSRNLTGCGGSFIPFGAIDAIKTSEMTTRMILDALSDKNIINGAIKYKWWCGKDELAKKNNIKTTSWYTECNNIDVSEQINSMISEGCPVCRMKN